MPQQSHYWAYTLRKPKLKRTHLSQYYLHWLGHESNLAVH